MKIYISRASDSWGKGKVNEYADLQDCISTLLDTETFGDFDAAVIVSRSDDMTMEKCGTETEYEVMIYDTWIE